MKHVRALVTIGQGHRYDVHQRCENYGEHFNKNFKNTTNFEWGSGHSTRFGSETSCLESITVGSLFTTFRRIVDPPTNPTGCHQFGKLKAIYM